MSQKLVASAIIESVLRVNWVPYNAVLTVYPVIKHAQTVAYAIIRKRNVSKAISSHAQMAHGPRKAHSARKDVIQAERNANHDAHTQPHYETITIYLR